MNDILKKVSLFNGLSDDDLNLLSQIVETIYLSADEELFAEKTVGDQLYIVKEGQIDLMTMTVDKETHLAARQPGEVIEEMALLDAARRFNAAKAISDSVLLTVGKTRFDALLDDNPMIARKVLRAVGPRWRENDTALRQNEQITRDQAEMLERVVGALQFSHDDLEERVTERTVELAKTNAQLTEQIAERQRAEKLLEEYNQTLEAKVEERTEQLEAQIDQLSTLNLITHTVASVRELETVLKVVARAMIELFNVESSSVALSNPEHTELKIVTDYSKEGFMTNLVGTTITLADNSAFSKVIKTSRPLIVPDAQTSSLTESIHNTLHEKGTHILVIVPLKVRGQVIGIIGLNVTQSDREFTQSEVSLAETVAGQVAGAIENARLFETERTAREQAETLHAATQALSTTLDLQEIFKLILKELQKVVPYDSASVQQLKENKLKIIGGIGFDNMKEISGTTIDLALGTTPNQYVIQNRKPFILQDASVEYAQFSRLSHIASWLGVPLLFGDQLMGMITLDKHEINFYNDDHARLAMAFATQAAIAIENARLYTEAEEARQRLKEENLRLGAELEITRELQQMLLPHKDELCQVDGLDIAGFMEPAEEVGGDYYDVLQHDGHVKIGIGDVTGHGLHSGLLMVMTQTAVRTLLTSGEVDSTRFLSVLNRAIYDNVQRMKADKSLTLTLIDYEFSSNGKPEDNSGKIRLSGQHEELIVVRRGGEVELIDTFDLGFPIGLEQDITDFVDEEDIELQPGDGIVLYTDGITEAENLAGEQYGIMRLCRVVSRHWSKSAEEIKEETIADVHRHIGKQIIYDDLTLVIVKQE
jgi:serine phosphatase RsbU (regulator of sigma subunit)/CRP-like cAMP-binding protein